MLIIKNEENHVLKVSGIGIPNNVVIDHINIIGEKIINSITIDIPKTNFNHLSIILHYLRASSGFPE